VRPLLERNVQLHPVRTPQDFDLRMFATLVEIEAMGKQREASCGRAVHAEDDVLNSQTCRIRRTTRQNVGYDDSKISFQVESGRQLWGDGLNEGSYRGLVDVAILQQLWIGGSRQE